MRGTRPRVDFELTLGTVPQEVLVSAAPPLLERESSALRQVIETRAIEDLPVRGGNFQTLTPPTAGVTPATGASRPDGRLQRERPPRAAEQLSGRWNRQQLERSRLQNRQAQVLIPSLDAVREFKVSTSNYSAELAMRAR